VNDCRLKVGGVMIEGKTLSLVDGLNYLKDQGFTAKEALEYMKTLPLEE